MLGLIFWVAAGAIVLFLAPPLVPGQYRNWFVQNTLRAVGLAIIGFGVLSTSFVQVPNGHVGHLFRIYGGGPLGAGRIVAANGENGPQAEIFTPGFILDCSSTSSMTSTLGTRRSTSRRGRSASLSPRTARRCGLDRLLPTRSRLRWAIKCSTRRPSSRTAASAARN